MTKGLTRSFRTLVQKCAAAEPVSAEALLSEGVNALLTGEMDVGRSLLRGYITATVGLEKLGEATGMDANSLVRMFGPRGNPQARGLFGTLRRRQILASQKRISNETR